MSPSAGERRERFIAECSHEVHRLFQAFWAHAGSAWLEIDLSMTQLRNLIVLSVDGSRSVGELAAALGVSEPSASQIVDRLAQRALVRRDPDPSDRRRILVSITGEGERLLDVVRSSRAVAAEQLLEQLDDESLQALAKGMRALADAAGASEHPHRQCGLTIASGRPAAEGRS